MAFEQIFYIYEHFFGIFFRLQRTSLTAMHLEYNTRLVALLPNRRETGLHLFPNTCQSHCI